MEVSASWAPLDDTFPEYQLHTQNWLNIPAFNMHLLSTPAVPSQCLTHLRSQNLVPLTERETGRCRILAGMQLPQNQVL